MLESKETKPENSGQRMSSPARGFAYVWQDIVLPLKPLSDCLLRAQVMWSSVDRSWPMWPGPLQFHRPCHQAGKCVAPHSPNPTTLLEHLGKSDKVVLWLNSRNHQDSRRNLNREVWKRELSLKQLDHAQARSLTPWSGR